MDDMSEKELERLKDDVESINRSLVDYGLDAISKMTGIAEDTEHPRSFEVLSKLIKDVSDINNSRIDNVKRSEEIKNLDLKKLGSPTAPGETPKTLTIGVSDLLKHLKNEEKDVTPPDA